MTANQLSFEDVKSAYDQAKEGMEFRSRLRDKFSEDKLLIGAIG